MITRRGFLAGSAAALMAHAADPSSAQQTPRTRVVDIHAHWYPPQWLELIEKESGDNGARIERNARGNMVIVIPGLSVTFQPQYTDIPSRLKTMDQAGVTMHALSLTQPMVYCRQEHDRGNPAKKRNGSRDDGQTARTSDQHATSIASIIARHVRVSPSRQGGGRPVAAPGAAGTP